MKVRLRLGHWVGYRGDWLPGVITSPLELGVFTALSLFMAVLAIVLAASVGILCIIFFEAILENPYPFLVCAGVAALVAIPMFRLLVRVWKAAGE